MDLGRALADAALEGIVTSPLERARETAAEIARATGLTASVDERLTELDYGEWTGRTLDELSADPRWRPFNVARSTSRIPGGELALEAQARALAALTELRGRYGDGRIAVVSHADVIRGVLVHCLGMPLDLSLRLEIEPASVSTVTIGDDWVTVHGVNSTAAPFRV